MRAAAIGILALFCGGCAAPAFDLVSRDPESPWLAGQRWVRTESSRATVKASFDRAWLDHLIFEVEVVNQTDSAIVVDPERFSFTLSSSRDDLPKKLKKSFAAVNPATVIPRIERAIPHGSDSGALLTALAGLVLITAVALDLVEFGNMSEPQQVGEIAQLAVYDGDPHPAQPRDFARARERYANSLLYRTELAPGKSVRGELWMPARPVHQVVGPAPPSENSLSITATPAHPQSGHALTLRTPDELGGQEIEFSIAEW